MRSHKKAWAKVTGMLRDLSGAGMAPQVRHSDVSQGYQSWLNARQGINEPYGPVGNTPSLNQIERGYTLPIQNWQNPTAIQPTLVQGTQPSQPSTNSALGAQNFPSSGLTSGETEAP